jgi:hypothetical protein
MAFNATWSPGPQAVAGMQNVGLHTDQPVLVMYLDQESLAIMALRGRAMWPEFVRFLRQLRDGAEEMAEFFDLPTTLTAEHGDESATTGGGGEGGGRASAAGGGTPDSP